MFVHVVRSLLGVLLLAYGLNGFLGWFDAPSDIPSDASRFLSALTDVPYLWPLVAGLEVLVGALLLFKRWVPLALVLLAPLSVHLVLYHAFLDPAPLHALPAYLVATANVVLAALHHEAYRPLFR